MEKKAPGKGFLKVVGILLIIGGVFGFIGAASNAFVASIIKRLIVLPQLPFMNRRTYSRNFSGRNYHICHSGRYLPGSRNFRCGKLHKIEKQISALSAELS